MKKILKSIVSSVLLITILNTSVFASGNEFISLGKDLNSDQRSKILSIFAPGKDVTIIETNNDEEVKYLGDYVDRKILGYKSMSSSYVKPLKKGQGITVETYNITWVTEDMLISALATAGVKDAYVKVAAPFNVTGTAALTGIIKGFEGATGQAIGETEKKVASEEIATTGQLAEDIGSDQASSIINVVKEEVVENKIKDPEEIRKIIENASQDINISLTDEQKEKITSLMEKISNLDLNVEDIKNQVKNIKDQVKNISDKIDDLGEKTDEVKSIVSKILDFVKGIFDKIKNLVK